MSLVRLRTPVTVLGLLGAACVHDTPRVMGPGGPSFAVSAGAQGSPWTDAEDFVVDFSGSPSQLAAAVGKVRGVVVRAHPAIGIATVSGLDDAAAANLARSSSIRSVTRDLMVQWIPGPGESVGLIEAGADVLPAVQNPPNTAPFLNTLQWNLRTIRAPEAWATGSLGQGVRVAILDSGIDDTHPEMQDRVDHTRSTAFTPNQNSAALNLPPWGDDNLHGTYVASVVASNAFRTASIAPGASLIAVKVLNKDGAGSFGNVIAGIVHATNVGADIINMSLGAYFPKNARGAGLLNAALAKAVNYAVGRGVFVVAASGTQGVNLDADQNFVSVPAQSGAAFAVSGSGPIGQQDFDHLAHHSNYGRSGPAVAAPGGEFGQPGNVLADAVLGPCSKQTLDPVFAACRSATLNVYVFGAGTSGAAPHAAGVAALIEARAGGGLTAGALRTAIQQSADDLGKPGVDLFYSHGRINAFRAVTQ